MTRTEKAAYERIKAKNPKHKKIAVVASMRRLGIRMWHRGAGSNARDLKTTKTRIKRRIATRMRLRRRIFGGMTRMSDGRQRLAPGKAFSRARGPRRHRRILGLVIPCQVASPQSLTPFHQANSVYHLRCGKEQPWRTNEKEVEV